MKTAILRKHYSVRGRDTIVWRRSLAVMHQTLDQAILRDSENVASQRMASAALMLRATIDAWWSGVARPHLVTVR